MFLQQSCISTKLKLTLENLPNELWHLIFDYLYCYEIIYAFFNLNIRFQSLLHSYSSYHLNSPNETKRLKFNLIQQLPLNIKHVKSLILSKNPYAITDLHQFLSIYPFELFRPTLQFLSLTNIYAKLMFSMICSLRNFKQIKYLKISNESNIWLDTRKENLFRQIILYKIKTLKYFIWNTQQLFLTNDYNTCTQKIAIEHFHFDSLTFDQLEWLYSHAINLKSISILNLKYQCSSHLPYTFEKLVCLKLGAINFIENIQFIFKHLTCLINLKQLELDGQFRYGNSFIDGFEWKDLIEKYIPQLKIFKFYFSVALLPNKSIKVDQLIESFQTDFWLINRRWFVTCDYYSNKKNICYYTTPCIRNKLEYPCSWTQISTTTTTQNETSTIRQLTLDSVEIESIKYNHQFINVQSLILKDQQQNINYNQLKKLVNFSSVTHVEFQSNSNFKLLFDILENISTQISLTIHYKLLIEIMRKEDYLLYHLKKINSLHLRCYREIGWERKYASKLCTYFPNIEVLIFQGFSSSSGALYLIGSLEYLSLLVTRCSGYQRWNWTRLNRLFIVEQIEAYKKNSIICKWEKKARCLWIE